MSELLAGPELAQRVRKMADGCRSRLWVATPYLGGAVAVRRILGSGWQRNGRVEVRLLTDIGNGNWVNTETRAIFHRRGSVRSLRGLHAKVYIMDDNAVATSANLTGTAFSKRHEVGVWLSGNQARNLVALFESWWQHKDTRDVSPGWIPATKSRNDSDEPLQDGLTIQWNLPEDPGAGSSDLTPANPMSLSRVIEFLSSDRMASMASPSPTALYKKAWANAHPEKILAANRKYFQANRERIRKRRREARRRDLLHHPDRVRENRRKAKRLYRLRHPDLFRKLRQAANRRYVRLHPDRVKRRRREYRQANRERILKNKREARRRDLLHHPDRVRENQRKARRLYRLRHQRSFKTTI